MKTHEIVILSFSLGFLCGGYMISFLNNEEIKKEERITQNKFEKQVVDLHEQKKDSAMSQQTIIIEKSYSPYGKLNKETIKKQKMVANRSETKDERAVTSLAKQSSASQSFSSIKSVSKSNWLVGTYAPINDFTDFTKYNFVVGYRVFSGLFVTLSGNLNNNFSAGLNVVF